MFLRAKQSRSVRQILLAMAMGLAMVAIGLLILSCGTPTPRLRFVKNEQGDPITGTVRVLCYTSLASTNLLTDVIRETNAQGVPTPDLPAGCDYVAALHLKHEQPSGWPNHGPAYWVYATSWKPGTTTPLTATGNIIISDTWPLVLFKVVASLAWDPALDSDPVAKDLKTGLLHASEYLYDLTDGRMAFGPIEVYTGGDNWNSADLRFLAANDYRPSAYVGGMVEKRIYYNTSPVTEVVFSPGPVYLGRDWSRRGASDTSSGRWYTDDAHRTIIHEWAHYALFLYDEYQDINGDCPSQASCTCEGLPAGAGCANNPPGKAASAMAWQYTATELWHPDATQTPVGTCKNTEQYEIHGQSDWETLAAWYQIQGLSGVSGLPSLAGPSSFSDLNAGPALGLAGDLFGRMPGGNVNLPSTPPAVIPTPPGRTVNIEISPSPGTTQTRPSQVYLLKEPSGAPHRILHQGKAIGPSPPKPGFLGTIHVLGAEAGDQLGIFVDRQATAEMPNGGRYTFIGALPGPGGTVIAQADEWQASLDITPVLNGSLLTGIEVMLTSLSHPDLNPPPTVQLCVPDAAIGCGPEIGMNQVDTETWAQTITHSGSGAELPRYGVLRVRAEGVGEIIRWFQDGGGVPPAHDDGGSPVADGLLKVHTNDILPDSSLCNRVMFMPAASYEALTTPLGEVRRDPAHPQQAVPVQGVLGAPLDIDFVLPINGECRSLGPGGQLPVSVTLTLFYNQDTIVRLNNIQNPPINIDEADLRILHYSPGRIGQSRGWSEVSVASRDRNRRRITIDPNLNWITTEPVREAGIYAIAWITDRPPTPTGRPPAVKITSPVADSGPKDDKYVYDGFDPELELWYKEVVLEGSAFDPEDGPLGDSSLVWTTDRSDIQSPTLGTGEEVTARLYSDTRNGVWHEITLTAMDSSGNAKTSVRRIRIWTDR